MTTAATEIDDIAEVMLICDIHVGFAEKRLAAARALHADGISAEDLRMLADHCREWTDTPAGAAKVLWSMLGEPAKRDAKLADLRKQRDIRAAKQAPRGKDSDRPIGPLEGEDPAAWDRDRMCRMAASLHRSDRWPVERVARELHIDTLTAQGMIDRGIALCSSPILDGRLPTISPAEAAKAQRQERQRTDDFRQRMRDDKARSAAGRKPVGIDWKRLTWHKADLLEIVRQNGKIDLATVRGDKARMGALAELEAAGHILRDGPPDADSVQPYRIATSDEQRREFRAQLRAWCHADMERKNHRAAGVVQEAAV